MAELFIELFSEEIPGKLQTDFREKGKRILEEKLIKKNISFKSCKTFSTPTRLVFFAEGIPEKVEQKGKVIKGPKAESSELALAGFIKSNNLKKTDVYKKEIDKGKFYFAETPAKNIDVLTELKSIIPDTLKSYSWKKSMKWSTHDLNWGRPLKSIVALFNNQIVEFKFFHLKSSNLILLDSVDDLKLKKIDNFKSYLDVLKSQSIILDQEKRKSLIIKKMNNICDTKNLKSNFNENLVDEVVNLVENPNIILCKFDEIYLNIPQEILIVTMQQHQKYFPIFEKNNKLTNLFLLVANLPDSKGFIKIGNQRVIEARLSDAKFFWDKNKNQNLVKQVGKLKNLSFFNQLGSFYDKTQRLRNLAGFISDELNLSKEKTEIASSICKADLVSDLVGEYPELQGVMGKYFAAEQGFDKDISLAISDHYLPTGLHSEIPKRPISIAVSIIDKIDTLVGFFGINQKPTSSKDPFALRRTAIGLLRIIIENKQTIELKSLISNSIKIYEQQNTKFRNDSIIKEILTFLNERFKNILKEKKIRSDIIDAVDSSRTGNNFLILYKKCLIVNKNISKDICKNIIGSYKRVSNIIGQELNNKDFSGQPDSLLFLKDEEKNLYKKVSEIQNYFLSTKKFENYDETLKILGEAKPVTDMFFDNVIVNDDNLNIKKNRLELLQMFCRTYNNFIDFSKLEGA